MLVTDIIRRDLFKGKTAFITGGGSGINFGIARNFAALGANVVICSRSQERLDKAAESLREFGGKVGAIAADVRDAAGIAGALARSAAEFGPVDTLISGAAGNFLCPAEKMSPNAFRTVVEIDLIGSFHVAKAGFEQLKETRGNIIFISAGLAWLPYALQLHAGAAKAGIDNMMKNMALEWGKYGIRTNSIAPGYIADTEGTSRLAPGPVLDSVLEATPLGRLGSVDEIAQMAVFLASPLAAWITGTVMTVDGGHYLGGSSSLNATLGRLSEG